MFALPWSNYRRAISLCLLLVGAFAMSGQTDKAAKKIIIRQADKGYYSKADGKNRLIGNVIFEHEGALMYCDSAWLYSADNRIRAFSNVRINQGDTLKLWGDYLTYSGQTRLAVVQGDTVLLKDPEMTLRTDRLNFDRNNDLAYYLNGGHITNAENTLISQTGYYQSRRKEFYFKDSVVLTNPDYVIRCDTLDYNSGSRIAYFRGPTTITSDSSFIYCENGLYNTVADVAQFEQNAKLYDDNKFLTGDSLYYEKHQDYGEAYGHVVIHDTVENYYITGGYGEYRGSTDSAFVTQEPLYSIIDEEGDTTHIHGDTLLSLKQRRDSLEYRLVKVFFGVQFFRSDLQGKCDSLTYSTLDSTFRMYRKPVVWDDSTQITGDTIYMKTRQNQPDTLWVFENAFMLSQVDSLKQNQVSGKLMIGSFKKGELRKVYVNGNGRTVYYPKEEDGDFIGVNRTECANILIRLQDKQVKKITFLRKSDGKLYRLNEMPPDQRKLPGYLWRFDERPTSKKALFK